LSARRTGMAVAAALALGPRLVDFGGQVWQQASAAADQASAGNDGRGSPSEGCPSQSTLSEGPAKARPARQRQQRRSQRRHSQSKRFQRRPPQQRQPPSSTALVTASPVFKILEGWWRYRHSGPDERRGRGASTERSLRFRCPGTCVRGTPVPA
jgi:hypothetical protein